MEERKKDGKERGKIWKKRMRKGEGGILGSEENFFHKLGGMLEAGGHCYCLISVSAATR